MGFPTVVSNLLFRTVWWQAGLAASETNLGLQILVALYQPQCCPSHACHLVVQALTMGKFLRKPACTE